MAPLLCIDVSAVENIAESINLLAKYVDGMQTETQHSLVQLIWGQQGLCSRLVEVGHPVTGLGGCGWVWVGGGGGGEGAEKPSDT